MDLKKRDCQFQSYSYDLFTYFIIFLRILYFYVYSSLSKTEIEEVVEAELDLLEEIALNKLLLPEDFSFETLKVHVKSIFCTCGQDVYF